MPCPVGDTRVAGRRRRRRRRGASAQSRRPRRLSDRDRLRPRRRRHQRPSHRAALRGQGPAGVQSADRPRHRSRRGTGAGAFRRRRGAAGASVLAGAADLVLPKAAGCPVAELATAGLDSIAVRVPHHAVAQKILAAFGRPIVAPSANRSGHVSPTTAAHVLADLRGRIDLIVDGGATPVGLESTIVACLDAPTAAAAGRPAARGDRARARPTAGRPARRHGQRTMRRSRPACSRPITRRARRCGSMPSASRPAKRLLAFGPKLVEGADNAKSVAQPVRARRPHRGRGQSVLAPARARCRRRHGHRRDAGAPRGPRRSHQRPAAARRRAAINDGRLRGAARLSSIHLLKWMRPMLDNRPASKPRSSTLLCSRASPRSSAKNSPSPIRICRRHIWSSMRNMFQGHTPVVLRPGSVAEVSAILKLANDTGTRDRAAGRQYRPGRRPDPAAQRDRAVAQPARPHPRSRSDLEHHHLRGRRHLAAHARGRGRSRPALSATAAVGRHLHHRRQSFHQCRRHRGHRPRHRALACARHRSGAGRRPHHEQSQQAEEGQHRLRSEKPVHRRRRHARHHHRGGAAAGAAAALGRDRVRRHQVAGSGAGAARHRHRAHRRRRHQLRDHDPARHRAGAGTRRGLSAIRSPRRTTGTR